MALNAQLVSRDMSYGQLTKTEQRNLKAGYGRLWEVMAAGNVIPLKTQGATTVNFEYLPKDKKELSLFGGWLEESLEVPTTFSSATLKLVIGKTKKITVNFKERKDPKESRKQTPTKIQEKGTTDVFNRVLANN